MTARGTAFLTQMTMAMLFFVGNFVFMHYLGDDGVGAYGISCYYLPFVFMIGNAIAQSAQPIISYNYGLGNPLRVHAAVWVSLGTKGIWLALSVSEMLTTACMAVHILYHRYARSQRKIQPIKVGRIAKHDSPQPRNGC